MENSAWKKYFFSPKIIISQIALLGALGGGILITSSHAHYIDKPSRNKPTHLIRKAHIEKQALNKVARKDSGRAKVYYNRHSHVLHFIILNMWSVPAFKAHKVKHQTKEFKKLAHLTNVSHKITISSQAKRRERIRLKENKEQAIEDKIQAQKQAEQQQRKAEQQKVDNAIKKHFSYLKKKQQANGKKAQQKFDKFRKQEQNRKNAQKKFNKAKNKNNKKKKPSHRRKGKKKK